MARFNLGPRPTESVRPARRHARTTAKREVVHLSREKLPSTPQPTAAYCSPTSLKRLMVDRTVAAEGVPKVYAPPAYTLRQGLHFQIPTAVRLTAFWNCQLLRDCANRGNERTFPQLGQAYRECWVISIFFTLERCQPKVRKQSRGYRTNVLRSEAP
jgi:hypothetical protein